MTIEVAVWSASAAITSARAELRADHRRRLPGVHQLVSDDRSEQEEVVGIDRGVMVTACRYVASTCGGARARGRSRRSRGRGTEAVVGGKG